MAVVTVKLNLQVANEVKRTLVESLERTSSILNNQALRNEYVLRGKDGVAEWRDLEIQGSRLRAALEEFS